ncbi:MAG: M48 family metallopeptidase [Alphaproteobacteria bacterium]|nr:M48 family metallopeptidase [Alphaproteobacteria bacterium]
MKITLLTGRTFDFAKELGFAIKTVKSSSARRLTLRIDEKERIPILSIPKYCSNHKALAFVEEHRDWIQNMLARLPEKSSFVSGSTFSLFGQTISLIHKPDQRGTILEKNQLYIGGQAEFLHRRTIDFIKKYTEHKLSEMSLSVAQNLGCNIHSISVKDTKSRWGSCSNRGNINYNWRIAFAPLEVIEYLVCHEVSHLVHPNHSQDFWACVASICPHHRQSRHWLKVKGKTLYSY